MVTVTLTVMRSGILPMAQMLSHLKQRKTLIKTAMDLETIQVDLKRMTVQQHKVVRLEIHLVVLMRIMMVCPT